MAGTAHSALCRISAQSATLVLHSVFTHNPSRLAKGFCQDASQLNRSQLLHELLFRYP
jgi:hypothetical protein